MSDQLERYLGVPPAQGRNKNSYNYIIEKVNSKLNGWKLNYLSFAGRQVLANAVLNTIPIYTMQTSLLPLGVIDNIEQKIRNFIWGGTDNKRGCNLVNWEIVTRRKEEGGLGVKRLRDMNLALITKLGWRYIKEPGLIWTEVLRDKYGKRNADRVNLTCRDTDSKQWQAIVKAADTIKQGARMMVLSGKQTYFWIDKWLLKENLEAHAKRAIDDRDRTKKVSDYWDKNQGWQIRDLEHLLSEEILEKLEFISLMETENQDEIYWGEDPSGTFSVRTAYDIITRNLRGIHKPVWKHIWKKEVPNRIVGFLWIVRQGRVMSNAERGRKGLTVNIECPWCAGEVENRDHLFRKCPKASEVWKTFIPREEIRKQRDMDFDVWFDMNIEKKGEVNGYSWGETFATILWWLWKWRNKFIFQGIDIQTRARIEWIQHQRVECAEAFRQNKVQTSSQNRHTNKLVSWQPPDNERIAINTDASYDNKGKAAGGTIARNSKGEWLAGKTFKIDANSVAEAECCAIWESLNWAWDKGWNKIIICSDAERVIQWIKGASTPQGPLGRAVKECRQAMSRSWDVEIRKVYREQNVIADRLAKKANKDGRRWYEWASPPNEVRRFVQEDMRGVPRIRKGHN